MYQKAKVYLLIFGLLFSAIPSYSQLSRSQYERVENAFQETGFFGGHLTGFVLYDLDSQQVLFEKNSQIRFTPASTTKLFTLFASLLILNDSTQTLRYVVSGDTLKVWGSGDPSWNYLNLPQPDFEEFFAPYSVIQFSDANVKSPAWGLGWQWDDYLYYYSAERSSLPIHGNLLHIFPGKRNPQVFPKKFQSKIHSTKREIKDMERDFHKNEFYYNPDFYRGREDYLPLITSPELFIELAADETGKKWIYQADSLPDDHEVWRGTPLFPILKEMMLESDNFLAEQLLFMVSDRLFGEIDTERTIEYLIENYLYDLPDGPIWVDGSGLSRYNLFTPRTMIALFEKLYRIVPDEMLLDLLPTGGVSGTIENEYKAPTPYIFAKTGTMSNNHSLVGLIKCKSGKQYAFSFMNSNYPWKASEVRREMEKVLVMLRNML
ncbi:D-alanyl-D-alanine carboxypeptidase/D-alanyl-D-alanine-endopeptidase [Algoriphagus limi]|uniref:D-alanyl-D-alanine carboxypeptidase n=1 Tax=Algoriphagus limi TaxID=2975273 RepID=A0ABT2G1B2_9BACT|nr:D-alanyl-D-alanine carboxypeptidase [Algoriphagus limi]MCS5489063.1 D-alanyl-D-alanine carboxypeptidase [Algoriphagus limi]